MLARHAFAYLLSHGIPALVGFAAIAVYTRLLTEVEYGRYALVFAIAAMINAIVFEWLKVSLLRYYPMYQGERPFLDTVKLSFIALAGVSAIAGLPLYFFIDGLGWVHVLLALILSWCQSWYQMNLNLIRSEFNPKLYGYLSFMRSVLALAFGVLLILAGFEELGLLWGLVLAFVVTLAWPTYKKWGGAVRLTSFKPAIIKEFAGYGVPLALTLLLGVVIHNSDRFIISAMIGVGANGTYSATYDLTEQTIFTLMLVINLAAFPLAVRTMEQKGESEALKQVKENTGLLLLIALPAMIGLIVLTPNVVGLMLGEGFREQALLIMPLIAVGAFLKGLKLYAVDIIFHLHKRTSVQVLPVFLAAVLNVVLTILLIPDFGLRGAAVATVVAYAAAILLSLFFMNISIRDFPFPGKDFIKILCASTVMGIVLWFMRTESGLGWLLVQVLVGLILYVALIWMVNALGFRNLIINRLRSRKRGES
ncbi:lipopolysaccharide biosynthesis protein [Alkalicoccobacillus murimartini]|uniref:O-antigen/teichoic acid export membrane protein n=1 Tax=Alkalicoccobacillus murimartini TaxID=171685 RepID=A0ABT9YG13_9BACI|nr:lipopolysaccharide biosynthesis protein [Alkalicoccobacillus murimartini]MDQ0206800.1 O-antigen/teichoic acid export membrane protein [Alkalicoccobacillus murimartini]